MGEQNKTVDILVMRAAGEIRKAAALDKKRATELSSVADYLESIVYEKELGYGEPLFPDAAVPDATPDDEIKKMMKPFKVRLTR
ncbi:MAG: hypothetical protein IT566_08520 [Rhodospirillaceae bacterium]|nr:hypothetical protein [Rhodospirillaceae bacterium]